MFHQLVSLHLKIRPLRRILYQVQSNCGFLLRMNGRICQDLFLYVSIQMELLNNRDQGLQGFLKFFLLQVVVVHWYLLTLEPNTRYPTTLDTQNTAESHIPCCLLIVLRFGLQSEVFEGNSVLAVQGISEA